MTDTLYRQWTMLRMIPREPRKIGVSELRRRLAEQEFEVTSRTIQRDLIGLAKIFPLSQDDRSKPYGWSWQQGVRIFDIPGMDPQTALGFELVEMFLDPVIPPAVRKNLEPYFGHAKAILRENKLQRWADHVRIIRSRQTLKLPDIHPEVISAVYDSLLHSQKFKVRYLRPHAEPADFEVNPLGLVFKDGVAYLVCTLFDYADIRQLALHRVESIEPMFYYTRVPKGFDLDDYIRRGHFDYPEGSPIKLAAAFSKRAAAYLRETPLSDDQTLRDRDLDTVLIEATVQQTSQLRWWLLSFGSEVEVLKPAALRREMAATARKMADCYGMKSP